jgi:predicted small lipoprotein YifL
MLKQFSLYAMRRVAFVIAAAVALSVGGTGCGVKGPLVPAPKSDANADAAPTTPPAPSPFIKDPTQPERRP